MSNNSIPPYLRLLTQDSVADTCKPVEKLDEVQRMLREFTRLTGWQPVRQPKPIDDRPPQFDRPSTMPPSPLGAVQVDDQDAETRRYRFPKRQKADSSSEKVDSVWTVVSAVSMDGMLSAADWDDIPAISENAALAMLNSMTAVLDRLEKAEQAIWRQEAELATAIGVTWRSDEQTEVATRLEETLQNAIAGAHCDAAAMYLLDEATSVLKMRSSIGLPKSRLAEDARQLRGSLADLEALLGNAVVLEDINASAEWKSPELFGSAICVPIGAPSMPHGTLWVWSEKPRAYNAAEVDIVKLAAKQLLSELERPVLADEVARARSSNHQIDDASLIQAGRLPDRQILDRRFDIDGWTKQGRQVGGNFHLWDCLPNESIAVAIASGQASGVEGALVATTLQSTIEATWLGKHTPSQMLQRLNRLTWGRSEGNWHSSLTYLQLNPVSGQLSMANAGDNHAYIISSRGFRPIGLSGPILGSQPDPTYRDQTLLLEHGEALVLFSRSVVQALAAQFNPVLDHILGFLRETLEESAEDVADHFARLLPDNDRRHGDPIRDKSFVIVRRNEIRAPK